MIIDDYWWWLRIINDYKWLLRIIDDYYQFLMAIDGYYGRWLTGAFHVENGGMIHNH